MTTMVCYFEGGKLKIMIPTGELPLDVTISKDLPDNTNYFVVDSSIIPDKPLVSASKDNHGTARAAFAATLVTPTGKSDKTKYDDWKKSKEPPIEPPKEPIKG